jgi:hypothetical protein
MSDFNFGAGQPGRIVSTPKIGQPHVEWIRPHAPRHSPQQMLKGRGRSERADAMIVIGLTLACTVMAIVDLFLLAAGS